MARPRKPTDLHVVHGTFRNGRHADRVDEPVIKEPLGDAPGDWKPKAKVLWHEVVNQIPPGVVTRCDRLIVELTVRLIAKVREDATSLTPALATQIRCCLSSLGMTPADRSRVSAQIIRTPSPTDEFFDD